MKIILSLLLLTFQFSFAQESNFAIITDPQIGVEKNANNLIEAVNDINKRQNISNVVVLGNITANGKFDEFVWAQEILDGLTVPYFVVGGEKDFFASEGRGSEIALLWGDNKNFLLEQNYSLVSLNSILSDYPYKNYIDIETLSLLRNKLTAVSSNRVITFSYLPIKSAVNSYNFFELTLDKKIFSFVGKEDNAGNNNSTYEGLYLNRKDTWGYLIVSSKKDSIYIEKILSNEIKKKVKPEIVKVLFSKPLVLESNKTTYFVQKGSLIWSVSLDKTIRESAVCYAKNIFTAFKSGTVNCLNDDGAEKWRYETNKKINHSPIISSDLLIVASEDGDIITLNAKTGDPHQIISIGEKITSGVSLIEIDEAGTKAKAIVAGTQYGNLYCYDLLTLDPIWTQQIQNINENLQIVSTIAFSNNKIFFQDKLGTLYCLSATNGMLIWKIESTKGGWKSSSNILVKNNLLYLIDISGNLFCVDALLGESKWNLKNINATNEIIESGSNEFILPTKKNKILMISTKLGKVTKEIEFSDYIKDESITDLLVIGDKIIIGFSDGWVYKINAKQKIEKYFRNGYAPIISLTEVNGDCLVTDYDGTFTLLKISK
jgi:outer membrane protein assembly factor BamB